MHEQNEPVSRRRFLQGLAAGTGAVVVASRVHGVASAAEPPPAGHHDHRFVEREGTGEDPPRPRSITVGARSLTRPVWVPPPPIVTRAQWGADESLVRAAPVFAPLVKLIVHHSASPNNPPDPIAIVQQIYYESVITRGYNDFLYNFAIDQNGVIYEGRRARAYGASEVHDCEDGVGNGVVGAHALYWNTGSCGVCLIGDFTSTLPSAAARASLAHLLAWKAGRHGIDPMAADPYTNSLGQVLVAGNICGHRDTFATACPGNLYYPLLPSLRTQVNSYLSRSLVGYRLLTTDGMVTSFGAPGGTAGPFTGAVAVADGPDVNGYYVLTSQADIISVGTAPPLGSLLQLGVQRTAIDLARTFTGRGYWILTTLGEVAGFGDAPFYGDYHASGFTLRPMRIVPTPSGYGYWLLSRTGRMSPYGDAAFFGDLVSAGKVTVATDARATPSGNGYWILTKGGTVNYFGDAVFYGSPFATGTAWPKPAVALIEAYDGRGYSVVSGNGTLLNFGTIPSFGSIGAGRIALDAAPVMA